MIRFTPNGFLDVATEPSDLPGEISGKVESSGAMRRCKNMLLERGGMAVVRQGSTKIAAAVQPTSGHLLVEHEGSRYEFAGESIYKDEGFLAADLTDAQWRAFKYNAYNVTREAIFALNGTNLKKIEEDDVMEWGIEAPSTLPIVHNKLDKSYTYDWEKGLQMIAGTAIDECDATTGWTASPVARRTLSADTSNFKEPTGSLKCVFAASAGATDKVFFIKKTLASTQDWSGYSSVQLFLYRDDAQPTKVSTSEVIIATAAGVTIHTFPISMPEDATWTLVTLDLASTGDDFSDVGSITIQRTYSAKYIYAMTLNIDYIVGYGLSQANIAHKVTASYENSYEYTYSWEKEHLDNAETMGNTAVSKTTCWWFELGEDLFEEDIKVEYTYLRKKR